MQRTKGRFPSLHLARKRMQSYQMWHRETHQVLTIRKSSSFTTIAVNNDRNIKPELSAKTNILIPPRTEPYDFHIQFDDDLHVVASFFRKATNWLNILMGVTSNALLTVASLLHMGSGPNLISNTSLRLHGRSLWNWFNRLNCELRVMNKEDILPFFSRIGDLTVRTWFGIVKTWL